MTTRQGRDHIVTVRSGESVMVIVNVHFEPDLSLRDLREKLRLISNHRPHYPEAFGVPVADLNICDPEEGRLHMAESRDFHCFSHVTDNLGERSTRSDHVAVRIVVQKPTGRCGKVKRIPSWMSKHPVFCTILKQISDSHRYPDDPLSPPSPTSTSSWKKREKRPIMNSFATHQVAFGAKLLTASIALRAHRNRHLGSLMHCCEA